MKHAEASIKKDSRFFIAVGSGAGYKMMKEKFSWTRAAVEITVDRITQTMGAK